MKADGEDRLSLRAAAVIGASAVLLFALLALWHVGPALAGEILLVGLGALAAMLWHERAQRRRE